MDRPRANCYAVIDDMSKSQGHVVAKYKFVKRLGHGSFGEVWLGYEIHTKEKVAIKVENSGTKTPQLQREYSLYSRYLQGLEGFPWVRHFAKAKQCNYFVMSLLGPSLQKLMTKCGGKFSLKTTLMIADQVIQRIEVLHRRSGYVSRDIKPDNLLIGKPGSKGEKTVFMIDLGLAKPFMDINSGIHIESRQIRRSLTGTARYASINAHYGADQSRRDDLESAGYVFVYMLKGKLPWQGIKASSKRQKYEKIREMKLATPTYELCEGIPREFGQYLDYCKELEFKEEPDYSFVRDIFRELMETRGYLYDGNYDWSNFANFGDDDTASQD